MTIGKTIKKYRELKGLTQKELGNLLGRTQRTVQAYEKGEVVPPLTIIDKLSDILGIETSSLINGEVLEEKDIIEKQLKTIKVILTNNREFTIECEDIYIQKNDLDEIIGFNVIGNEKFCYISNSDEIIAIIEI